MTTQTKMEKDLKKIGRRPKKKKRRPKKMEDKPINLIGCDTIVNSPSLIFTYIEPNSTNARLKIKLVCIMYCNSPAEPQLKVGVTK
jgi:hypothetical protein